MSELRRDPLRRRWVLVDDGQPVRRTLGNEVAGGDVGAIEGHCPLCPEGEATRANHLYLGPEDAKGRVGVRVVPNGAPLLRVERELKRSAVGPYSRISGTGAHEVFIETPEHGVDTAALEVQRIADLFTALRVRMLDLRHDVRLRHLFFFKQHGSLAGARYDHAHSQLLGLPVIPPALQDELEGARAYFADTERCVLCDMLEFESREGERMVAENSKFAAFMPYASARPFETWILPKRHCQDMLEAACDETTSLAEVVKKVLGLLGKALDAPPYVMTLINAPSPNPPPGMDRVWAAHAHNFHWRLSIVPRVTTTTALDWEAGLPVNPVSPETAAAHLCKVQGG